MEIPLLFPTLNEGVARYRIVEDEQGANKSRTATSALSLIPVDHHRRSCLSAATLSHWTASPSLQGAASVCRISTSDAVITTLLLEGEPWVLSVSALASPSSSSSATIELDLSTCTGFQGIARAQAFPNISNKGTTTASVVRLVLVDRNGIILQIYIDWDVKANSLHPQRSSVTMHCWTSSRNKVLLPISAVQPNSLNASRIGFLNHGHVVLLALSPFLFTINLNTDEIDIWHRGTCLDHMKQQRRTSKNRRSSLSIFASPVGKKARHIHTNNGTTFVDMNPVTAFTIAEDTSSNVKVVWTLHSDGVLRRWMLEGGDSNTLPTSLSETRPRNIPSPNRWNGENEYGCGAPQLSSKLYHNGQVGVCVISIPHVDGCSLSVVHGTVAGSTNSNSTNSLDNNEVSLKVPHDATSLISMDFDVRSEKCSLYAWFHHQSSSQGGGGSTNDDAHGGTTTVCVQYRPSVVSILDSNPTLVSSEDMLDRTVWKERQYIERMEPYDFTYELPLKEALHQVDQQFLRFLFRPMMRGITPYRAPSSKHIRNAVSKFVRISSSIADESGARSLEVEVVLAVHEKREEDNLLRKQQQQQRNNASWWSSSSPLPTTPRNDYPETTATAASARTSNNYAQATPHDGGMSIYDMIGMQQRDDNFVGGDNEDEAMQDQGVAPDNERAHSTIPEKHKLHDVHEEIDRHAARWRQFLLLIWEEEFALSVPLLMSSKTLFTSDVGILLRSGAISVLGDVTSAAPSSDPSNNKSSSLLAFDHSASELMSAVELDDSLALLLAKMEREHLAMVSSVDLALADHGEQLRCFATLDVLIEEVRASGNYHCMDNEWPYDLSNALENDIIAALEDVTAFMPTTNDSSHTTTTTMYTNNASASRTVELGRQNRLAICGVVARNFESIQRHLLGRCLLLRMELPLLSHAFEACMRMYSHIATLRWVAAQQIPIPSSKERLPILGERPSSCPPRKRPSLDGLSPSILDSRGYTCVLDAYLLHFIRPNKNSRLIPDDRLSIASSALAVSREITRICLRFTPEPKQDTYWEPPELSILAPNAFLHPKLQLLLLAPHIAFPRANDEPYVVAERVLKMAASLLMCAESEPVNRAREMVARAFYLLPFDPRDVNKSSRHFEHLAHQVGKSGDGVVITMFMDYIENAIAMMNQSVDQNQLASTPLYGLLWSSLFQHSRSSQVQNWEKAFYACLKNPDARYRITNLRYLAENMVSHGSLSELVKLCKSNGCDGTELGFQEFMRGINMYEIARDALSESPYGVSYADRLAGSDGTASNEKALYALHASKNEWNRAAQAIDVMYTNAIAALRTGPSDDELPMDDVRRREMLIISDLLVSALACFAAVASVDDTDSQFLTSEDPARDPSPIANTLFESTTGKRHRESGVIGSEVVEHQKDKSRTMRYLNLNDLEARSAFAAAFSTLYDDDRTEGDALKCSFLECHSPSIGDKMKIIDCLFVHGDYEQGLITSLLVASDTPGSMLGGQTIFHESLVDLLCTYLVPLSLGADTEFTAPLPQQLNHALDALSSHQSSLPPVLATRRSKKQSQLLGSYLEACALTLLQRLTSSYSSSIMPLVTQVAESYLSITTQLGRGTPLPAWLESLLIRGTKPVDKVRSGTFARPSHPRHEGYPGDPSALLSMYTRVGLYQDACKVVATVLSGDRDEISAPRLLPEKGDIDFVPYDKIDLLWSLIDIEIERSSGSNKSKQKKLQEARQGVEKALEHHFRLLKISEMGQRSARALPTEQ